MQHGWIQQPQGLFGVSEDRARLSRTIVCGPRTQDSQPSTSYLRHTSWGMLSGIVLRRRSFGTCMTGRSAGKCSATWPLMEMADLCRSCGIMDVHLLFLLQLFVIFALRRYVSWGREVGMGRLDLLRRGVGGDDGVLEDFFEF